MQTGSYGYGAEAGYSTSVPTYGMTTRPWDYPWLAKATSRIAWAITWTFLAFCAFIVFVTAAATEVKTSEVGYATFIGLVGWIAGTVFAVQYWLRFQVLQEKIAGFANNILKSERMVSIALTVFLVILWIFWIALMGAYSSVSACPVGISICSKLQATLAFGVFSFLGYTWAGLMAILDLF